MAEYIVMVDEQRKLTDHPNDPLPWLLGLPALKEIIHCRDCEFYTPETIKFSDGTYGSDVDVVPFCDKLRRETNPNYFCSWGERK